MTHKFQAYLLLCNSYRLITGKMWKIPLKKISHNTLQAKWAAIYKKNICDVDVIEYYVLHNVHLNVNDTFRVLCNVILNSKNRLFLCKKHASSAT